MSPKQPRQAQNLFAAAGAIWHSMAGSVKLRAAAVALALAVFSFVFYNGTHDVIAIRYAKGQKLKKEEFVQWNSFSRIAVRDYLIFIDADASTGIASFRPSSRACAGSRAGMIPSV